MNGVQEGKPVLGQLKKLKCTNPGCGATFTRQWKLEEHETVHTGARPLKCAVAGCGHCFPRRSHLRRHMLQHQGVKQFQCKFVSCTKSFYNSSKLKKHVLHSHGEKAECYKCNQPNCSLNFKKRRLLKLHLQDHGISSKFKCTKKGCSALFDNHVSRKAHEKKHAGYRCPRANCQVLEYTWGRLQKHLAKHPASFECQACKKMFKKVGALRRHKRIHASHKPVLVCPREDCQAYFSTTFNLQHHIRKVHLELLKYKCSFPECPRVFAMRESMTRHLLRHDPTATPVKRRHRPKKSWQRRLNRHNQPMVEDNLQRLFTLRMRIARRTKVETNLAGLFNERKIPHYVDPEVNLRSLFGIKRPRSVEPPEVAPLKC
ncbi:P43 5S RNA-binding protein-like [Gouania willdenowi]|uniref:P43 5S RNA-binding protein-like n=1 Tax=Gouania willdenowi TaxID=441366 RepID=UPI001055D191|nr:P43 5S RNA-binding protein-like [Gouania willdenowi]